MTQRQQLSSAARHPLPATGELVVVVSEEAGQWCQLRALEWNNWPLFLGQVIVPLLLISIRWWLVISGLVILDLVWSLGCTQFVDLGASFWGARLVQGRWVTSLLSGGWLFIHGNPVVGILAATWPLMTLILVMAHPPSKAGTLQQMFIEKLKETL